MYYQDLTPYEYDLPRPLQGVMNVGWLDAVHPFSTGDVSREHRSLLRRACRTALANQMRGAHGCELCATDGDVHLDEGGIVLGSAEIWLLDSAGTIYAAPNLIVHYVESHHYMPPAQFLAALEWSDRLGADWNAQSTAHKLVELAWREHGET